MIDFLNYFSFFCTGSFGGLSSLPSLSLYLSMEGQYKKHHGSYEGNGRKGEEAKRKKRRKTWRGKKKEAVEEEPHLFVLLLRHVASPFWMVLRPWRKRACSALPRTSLPLSPSFIIPALYLSTISYSYSSSVRTPVKHEDRYSRIRTRNKRMP